MNPYESPTHCEKVRPDWSSVIWRVSLAVAIIGMVIAIPIANAMVWVEALNPYSVGALVGGLSLFIIGYTLVSFGPIGVAR